MFHHGVPRIAHTAKKTEGREEREGKERRGEDEDLRVEGFMRGTEQEDVTRYKQRWRGTSKDTPQLVTTKYRMHTRKWENRRQSKNKQRMNAVLEKDREERRG